MRRVRPALLGEPVIVVPLGVSVHTVRIPPSDVVPGKLLVKIPHICLRQQCGAAHKRNFVRFGFFSKRVVFNGMMSQDWG